jgi:hypothetical protein
LAEAVRTTLVSTVTDDAVAVNEAVLAPTPTVTDVGTVSALLLLDRVTVIAVVAALFSCTVQLTCPGPGRVAAAQTKLDTLGGAASTVMVRVAVVPFAEAVSSTLVLVVTDAAVAVNEALLDPAATTIDAGTVSALLLLASAIVVGVVAALFKRTVQLSDAGP